MVRDNKLFRLLVLFHFATQILDFILPFNIKLIELLLA